MAHRTELQTNDNMELVPVTAFDGPALELDFPTLRIGVAEYGEGPTGCTVFYFPEGASTAVDMRGGAIGASETFYGRHHAICFAGGSAFGLEVVSGVRAEILASRNYAISWRDVPLVAGAIIWDWTGRKNAIYPDKALGRAALKAARPGIFPLGPRGAGRSATVGKWLSRPYKREPAGQGGAFCRSGPTRIAVFTVVNALGAIIDRRGEVVRGHFNPRTGRRAHVEDVVPLKSDPSTLDEPPKGNTTLTLVATNQKLDAYGLRQLGRHVHSAMVRAIYPFHTMDDGDILFTATTNEVENPDISHSLLSHMASELAWDAVLNCFET